MRGERETTYDEQGKIAEIRTSKLQIPSVL
jgi:YD repeat-containing protein